jgi:hypothetical protein
MEFDEEHLRRLLRFSGPYSRFYQVLREELFAIGRWKRKPRGDPQKAIEQTRRNVES